MADWKYKIDMADTWERYPDEIGFRTLKSLVVDELNKALEDLRDIIEDEDEIMSLEDLISEIEITDDEEEFDPVWTELYDWADYNKVWIATF